MEKLQEAKVQPYLRWNKQLVNLLILNGSIVGVRTPQGERVRLLPGEHYEAHLEVQRMCVPLEEPF